MVDEDYCTGFDFGLGYRNLKAILFGNLLEHFCFSFKLDRYPELSRLFRVLRVLAFGLGARGVYMGFHLLGACGC